MNYIRLWLLAAISVIPGSVPAELTDAEKKMGHAIHGSLMEAGKSYANGSFDQAGAQLQQAISQLEAASQNGSAELNSALRPTIARIENAHGMLREKGVDLPSFQRPRGILGDPAADARRADELILAGLKTQGITPLPRSSDEVFLRRAYLDIAGRIPTFDEAETFLNNTSRDKRRRLVDELLASPAYVSNYLNYWTEILRIRDKLTKNSPGILYREWVRKALMRNMPYDQFVKELITARGYMWENPAAGFYVRDKNMPLDHLANAAQVFLGTQLQCAQCHDHPFDEWTQMDFYRLAAFTYGIETDQKPISAKKFGGKFKAVTGESWYGFVKGYTTPLSSRARFKPESELRLPEDYQYDDAKPFDAVKPMTVFGDQAAYEEGEDPSLAFAEWLASPRNPRFSMVIANRLWSKAMGVGIFEPVDDLSSAGAPSNEPLLEFLTQKMKDYQFNLKQFLRLVYYTEAYQREAYATELQPGEKYFFQGPVYRRMTAEQAWDSLMTMIVPEVDRRYGGFKLAERFAVAPGLLSRSQEELIPVVIEQRKRESLLNKMKDLEHGLDRARRGKGNKSGPKKAQEIQQRIAQLQKQIDETPGLTALVESEGKNSMDPLDRELREARERAKANPIYFPFSKGARRASELGMPAEAGHFLQEFGQSDRELIENSSSDASVTQALALLNGPFFDEVLSDRSVLMSHLGELDRPEDKIRATYLSVLTRPPNREEMSLCLSVARQHGARGYQDIVWALLNTREFSFVK